MEVFGCGSRRGSGCASTPKVTISYYFPKARSDIAITQTIGCYKNDKIRSIASATVTTAYLADYDSPVSTISYLTFDGPLLDSDTAVTLTDDGRLAAVNSSGTGEGAAVVKSVVALAGVFTGVHALNKYVGPETPQQRLCDKVNDYANSKNPPPQDNAVATISLTYKGRLEYIEEHDGLTVNGHADLTLEIAPDPSSKPIFTDLSTIDELTFPFSVVISKKVGKGPVQPVLAASEKFPAAQLLTVPQLDLLHVRVSGPVSDLSGTDTYWEDDIVVPTRIPTKVPITKAGLFGKTQTGVTLAASGLVNKLEYSKSSGVADFVGAAGQIANQAEGKTEAQLRRLGQQRRVYVRSRAY